MAPNTPPPAIGTVPQGAAALWTTADACAFLKVSKQTLYRMAARGDLMPIRVSIRCTRWQPAEVQSKACR